MSQLNEQFFFLSPVQVVKVTHQNLEEVAEWCGGRVAEVESRRRPGTMEKYVWVPTPAGSKISDALPGMFITKRVVATTNRELKVTWAVFRRDYFEANYFDSPAAAVDATWAKKEPKIVQPKTKEGQPSPGVVNVYVGNMADAEKVVGEVLGGQEISAINKDPLVKGGMFTGYDSKLPRDASLG